MNYKHTFLCKAGLTWESYQVTAMAKVQVVIDQFRIGDAVSIRLAPAWAPAGDTYILTEIPYVLLDAEGRELAKSQDPKALSDYAFGHGAVAVRHDYPITYLDW